MVMSDDDFSSSYESENTEEEFFTDSDDYNSCMSDEEIINNNMMITAELSQADKDVLLLDQFNQKFIESKATLDYVDNNLSYDDASYQRQGHLASLKERECKYHIYDPNAKYVKFRRVIVDWICQVGVEFGLSALTIHISIAFFDRILTQVQVSKTKLQLVSICCILVAAKHEEQAHVVPSVNRLMACSQNTYPAEQIRQMEVQVLQCLNWRLGVVVPLHFVGFYICQDIVFVHDICEGNEINATIHRYVRKYVAFFVDICQQEHEFRQHAPSILAATIVAVSRRAMKIEPMWNLQLTRMTSYTAKDLYPCFHHLTTFYERNFPTESTDKMQLSPVNVSDMKVSS